MNIETGVFDKRPCDSAIEWAKTQPDLHTAWEVCSRGGWMWWSLRNSKGNMPPKKISVAFAKACAKRAKEYADNVAHAELAAKYAADATYADAEAAEAAAYVAAEYAASATARYLAERQWQADWIREHVENPF